MKSSAPLTTVSVLVCLLVGVVEPVGALHEHHEPLQTLGVDAVHRHGVVLQGLLVPEALAAQRADERHLSALLLPRVFLLVFFFSIYKKKVALRAA